MRANRDDVLLALRNVLTSRIATEPAPTSYSVELSEGGVHRLLWGRCPAVRTRDPRHLAWGLLSHLDGHAPSAPGTVKLAGVLVAAGGVGVVVPAPWRATLITWSSRAEALGLTIVPGPYVTLDASGTATLVPQVDPDELAALETALTRLADRPGRTGPPRPDGVLELRQLMVEFDAGASSAERAIALLHLTRAQDRAQAIDAIPEMLPRTVMAPALDDATLRSLARTLTKR